jgi:hypothetical protein
MRRLASIVAVLGALFLAAPASADWTVSRRVELPSSGMPVDLATYAPPGDAPMRVVLAGSYSYLLDGSEIDAVSRSVSGQRDVASGPFVALPPGTRVLDEDIGAHRYTVEIPRARSMPIALNVIGLANRDLVTASEARANLSGAIEIEVLVPPAPPPTAITRARARMTQTASAVPAGAWAGGALGSVLLGVFAFVVARRRREHVAVLLRRAGRARAAIAREVIALGPAYDPVSASADRLDEAARQHAAHHRSITDALARTAFASSAEAAEGRASLARRKNEVVLRLEGLVARLEETATQLAGRNADAGRAVGVDRLLADLGADLDAAVEAEDELARV